MRSATSILGITFWMMIQLLLFEFVFFSPPPPKGPTGLEPIRISFLVCNVESKYINLSVKNIGNEQIPLGDWNIVVKRINVTTGKLETLCSYVVKDMESLDPEQSTETISFFCPNMNHGDELMITVTSPQGVPASQSCIAS